MEIRRWTRVASYALVVRDQRILLCRLSELEKHVGMWTLPGGGIEFGEHPERAVIREVKEETGLDIRVGKLLRIESPVYQNSDNHMHAIQVLYRAEVIGGEITPEQGGTTDQCAWFSKKEALSLPLVKLARIGVHLAL
jgi:ADP-ribose pyrophosphatase YjhB (NUDIX family)